MKSIASICLLFSSTLSALGVSEFSTSGFEIQLNNEDFEIKGICYQPTPIGQSGALPPYGDYYNNKPENAALWARDFPNFRRLGANVVRIYGWTPEIYATAANPVDHSAFLDAAYNNGVDPVYILINRYINPETDWGDAAAVATLKAEWESMATELANHPAVMGFLIGNEVNAKFNPTLGLANGDSVHFWNVMQELATAVKTKAPLKLVSVAITDRPDQVRSFDPIMTKIDFWALQVYRGKNFSNLLEPQPPAPAVPSPSSYVGASSKPLVITEFGYDALDGRIDLEWEDPDVPADAVENLLKALRADEQGADIVAGACVFEYADEWWKYDGTGNSPFVQERVFSWESGAFDDGEANEEWWGIFRIEDNGSAPDRLIPRNLYYRLASMWNAPFEVALEGQTVGDDLELSFAYPAHLRDQKIEILHSLDMESWTKLADNASGPYLNALDPSVVVQNETADPEWVSVTLTMTAPLDPVAAELINGDFEAGSSSGWNTGAGVVTTPVYQGTYALELSAPGGYLVPSAYQTVPASPGDEFLFSAYFYAEEAIPSGNTFSILKMVFRGAEGSPDLAPVSASTGEIVGGEFPGVESRPIFNSQSTAEQWTLQQVQAVAPPNTERVSFFILSVDESPNTIFVDSAYAEHMNATAADRRFFRMKNEGR